MSDDSASSRGVLYPSHPPPFQRMPAPDDLGAFVRWFWISEWDIRPGQTSTQHLLGFPACNLVVTGDTIEIAGPTTRGSSRELAGSGWAVGALLRPAAASLLIDDVSGLRDATRPLSCHTLSAPLQTAMNAAASPGKRHLAATSAFSGWLRERLGAPSEEGLLANRLASVAETDSSVLTVTDLAAHLHVSTRTVQRLSARHVGLPPTMLIRRRRLQEAAERIRQDPSLSLAVLATELGYADHAHLSNDFLSVLGFAPSHYRRSVHAR